MINTDSVIEVKRTGKFEYEICYKRDNCITHDKVKYRTCVDGHYLISHVCISQGGLVLSNKIRGIAHDKDELEKKVCELAFEIAQNEEKTLRASGWHAKVVKVKEELITQ